MVPPPAPDLTLQWPTMSVRPPLFQPRMLTTSWGSYGAMTTGRGLLAASRGHGTQLVNGELVSTICGVVQRINKLVSVAPLAGRYTAQLGDVVVGRVADIVPQRWKVDIHARQEAVLQLSAVNLPGSAQVNRGPRKSLQLLRTVSGQLTVGSGCCCRGGARSRTS